MTPTHLTETCRCCDEILEDDDGEMEFEATFERQWKEMNGNGKRIPTIIWKDDPEEVASNFLLIMDEDGTWEWRELGEIE